MKTFEAMGMKFTAKVVRRYEGSAFEIRQIDTDSRIYIFDGTVKSKWEKDQRSPFIEEWSEYQLEKLTEKIMRYFRKYDPISLELEEGFDVELLGMGFFKVENYTIKEKNPNIGMDCKEDSF